MKDQSEFLQLPLAEQREILQTLAVRKAKDAKILEKDTWICWVLEKLFSMPDSSNFAFKGGTSLSKVYGAIDRFSEDVDITIDYRSFSGVEDPITASRTKRKNISKKLKQQLLDYIHGTIKPYFDELSKSMFDEAISIEIGENDETLEIHYPSDLDDTFNYMKPFVLLEFGARNVTEPFETHNIKSLIHEDVDLIQFPTARVKVLSAERTFWEKATLMHAECNRTNIKESADRISRHWYDLAMLASTDIKNSALNNLQILKDVLEIKDTFYYASWAKYEQCTSGNFSLLPETAQLKILEVDYIQMLDAQMIGESAISFDEICERLNSLEKEINKITKGR